MKTAFAAAFSLAVAASPVFAGDWPMFRGPERNDISTESGLLKQWSTPPKQLWVINTAGLGYSGFSVVRGTLYTQGARGAEQGAKEGGKEYLIAIDANTGKEKWAAEIGDKLPNGWGDGPRATPSVDEDRVYAMGGKGNLICASATDGKILWTASMTEMGGSVPGWGYTESPLVDGANVMCTPGGNQGTMVALDKMTGAKVWQSAEWTDKAQYASIIPADIAGNRQYIQLTMQSIAGVEAKSGKLMWKMAFPGKTAVIPTPIYKDGHVYVAAGYGVGCMNIDVSSGNSASQTYENNVMVNHHGGVILVGDYLYGFSDKGGWTCQDWKTGEAKWQVKGAPAPRRGAPAPEPAAPSAAPVGLGKGAVHCADGMLYLLGEDGGTVVMIEASPEGWKEHGRFTLTPQTAQRSPKGKIWTHPVVSNGKLYLRDQEYVYCYDVRGS